MKPLYLFVSLVIFCGSAGAVEKFSDGPLIIGYGKHASIEHNQNLTANTRLKVAFDVGDRSAENQLNGKFDSLARFLNMHVANGIPAENIELALVVHGKAGLDLLNDKNYQKMAKINNPNHQLLSKLMEQNVKVFICGQSAAYMQIAKSDLIPGVQMSLSAMTTHALLQNEGYHLNPF
ncbi:MAG: intracellular sulfur oxidation DsrE/DsrF family protein [Paraglaciecola sp.]|jgi:intracellular sulfur oxidation DsrE/DsrF family protein